MSQSRWIPGSTLALVAVLVACGGGGSGEKQAEAPAPKVSQPAAPVLDPATVASLSGKVHYKGAEPKPARIKMDAEPACAKIHGDTVYAEDLVVNPNGTLRNALVYVRSGLPAGEFASSQKAVLDQRGCVYAPRVVGVVVGQEIEIRNSDPTTHNIHPLPKQNREWNKSQAPGGEPLRETFAREEIAIPVKCNVHPWMKSYIAVLKHPFFSVTGDDGSFYIPGLPPGQYTIEVWHEKLGTQTQSLTLGPQQAGSLEFTYTDAGPAQAG